MSRTPPAAVCEQESSASLVEIAFDFLATYRLTTLIKDDKITEDIRRLMFDRFGEPDVKDPHKLSYVMACPWCLSVYFGAVAVIARQRWPRAWGPMARILTFSAMTGLLAEARTRATDKAAAADEPTLVTTQDSRDDEKSISQ